MRLGVASCAVAALGLARPALAEPARTLLRAETGLEYDSNAGRVEEVRGSASPGVVGSPVARAMASFDLAASPGSRQALALSGGIAAKRFTHGGVRDEDALVGQASGTWSVLVAGRTSLALVGSYYDVFQRRTIEARDFRSMTPVLRLDQGLGGSGLVSLGAGHRWFTYKPHGDYDFAGPTAFAGYRHLFTAKVDVDSDAADWELGASASLERRSFQGLRCVDAEQCPGAMEAGHRRRDLFWIIGAEATRTGAFLAGGGLAVHGNRSNSFGEPLLRGVAHLRGVFLLPWQLSLSGRAELLATRYLDAVPLRRDLMTGSPLVSIEDESRSTVRFELARPIGAHLDAGVRYAFFTNEITGGPVSFRRHTALVFLAVSLER